MKGLIVDGPNRGQHVNIVDRPGTVFKVIDPSERLVGSYAVEGKNPLDPIKVNTYYLFPTNPFAQAYGFDVLLRWSYSNY